jgi:DNA-binding transcriptional LysR family regulator
MTLKQLEAFVWVVRLGAFAAAAQRLNTSQSTLSSRILELETTLGTALFDRQMARARLTPKGRELLPLAERMLALHSQIIGTVGNPHSLQGVMKVGVAEFIALSWLPQWVTRANQLFPGIVLEIDVDLTLSLQQKLAEDALDLVLLPGPTSDLTLVQWDLGSVEFAWMAHPSLKVPPGRLSPSDLERFPIILLSFHSNLHAILKNWFEVAGVNLKRVDVCNSMMTVASMTRAGVGISYLPKAYHAKDISEGQLKLIDTEPVLEPLNYAAAYRVDRHTALAVLLSDLAVESSTFDMPILGNRSSHLTRRVQGQKLAQVVR